MALVQAMLRSTWAEHDLAPCGVDRPVGLDHSRMVRWSELSCRDWKCSCFHLRRNVWHCERLSLVLCHKTDYTWKCFGFWCCTQTHRHLGNERCCSWWYRLAWLQCRVWDETQQAIPWIYWKGHEWLVGWFHDCLGIRPPCKDWTFGLCLVIWFCGRQALTQGLRTCLSRQSGIGNSFDLTDWLLGLCDMLWHHLNLNRIQFESFRGIWIVYTFS